MYSGTYDNRLIRLARIRFALILHTVRTLKIRISSPFSHKFRVIATRHFWINCICNEWRVFVNRAKNNHAASSGWAALVAQKQDWKCPPILRAKFHFGVLGLRAAEFCVSHFISMLLSQFVFRGNLGIDKSHVQTTICQTERVVTKYARIVRPPLRVWDRICQLDESACVTWAQESNWAVVGLVTVRKNCGWDIKVRNLEAFAVV